MTTISLTNSVQYFAPTATSFTFTFSASSALTAPVTAAISGTAPTDVTVVSSVSGTGTGPFTVTVNRVVATSPSGTFSFSLVVTHDGTALPAVTVNCAPIELVMSPVPLKVWRHHSTTQAITVGTNIPASYGATAVPVVKGVTSLPKGLTPVISSTAPSFTMTGYVDDDAVYDNTVTVTGTYEGNTVTGTFKAYVHGWRWWYYYVFWGVVLLFILLVVVLVIANRRNKSMASRSSPASRRSPMSSRRRRGRRSP